MKRLLSLLAALVLVNGVLLATRWTTPAEQPVPWVALEAVFVVGLVLVLRSSRLRVVTAFLLALATVVTGVLIFADVATEAILARPLNLYLDIHLARSVYDLLAGTLGTPLAWAALAAVGVSIMGIVVLLTYLLSASGDPEAIRSGPWSIQRVGTSGLSRAVGLAMMTPLALWIAGLYLPVWPLSGLPPRVAAPSSDWMQAQGALLRETLLERDRFVEDLATAPADYGDIDGLLARLEGRDVILAFIESYGISAVTDPRYAAVIGPRLEDLGRRMDRAGLSIASGTLVAPTQGGQSWFSHGSLLSGLWLDNQQRYDLMLASGRETLVDDFRRAGYRTVALMPAITFAWPEGEQFGYDRVYARADIDYGGPPLNWVTMPDQFSWWFLEQKIRNRSSGSSTSEDRRPLFVEVGMISSHAPWTPILPVLEDWEAVGEGQVFAEWENAGERPEDLWRDPDRVREHFALSLDYAIHAMASYAERYVDETVLLIAMGDHQPAPLITGTEVSWEVPVHIISSDPELIAPFLEWGFETGAVPPRVDPERGMDFFRDWFVRAYSGPTRALEATTSFGDRASDLAIRVEPEGPDDDG